MAVVKNSVCDKTAFLTAPDKFWVKFGIEIFNHISNVSDDAKYDVICCLFSAKMDYIYARLCSVMKLNASRKIIVLKLINEEFDHTRLRNYTEVSKVYNTYFYGNIVVAKILENLPRTQVPILTAEILRF